MVVKTFCNLSDFMDWAEEFNKGEYLFRGVKKASYIKDRKVETSSERRLSDDQSISPEEILEINKDLMEKVRSIGHDQKDGKKLSDLNLLAELQHFGAATCLIDFTYSALIALWFACQQEQQEPGKKQENGKIVVLRSDGLKPLKEVDYDMSENKNIDHFFETDDMGRYPRYRWQPQHQNNRIIAQQSVFVFGAAPIKAEYQCEIRTGKKVEILEALEDVSGITGERLFADFYGYAWLNAGDKSYIEPTAEAYRRKGIKARQKGDTKKATDYLTKTIKMESDSENDENYRERGLAYDAAENYDKAIDDYEMALKLTSGTLNTERAFVYNLLGIARVAKGKAIMKEAIMKQNETPAIAEDTASEVEALFTKAESEYNKAINYYKAMRDDELTKVYNNLGNVYRSKGVLARQLDDPNGDKADKLFDKAIRNYDILIEKENEFAAVAYYNKGETYAHKFDGKQAEKELKTAKEKGVDIVKAFENSYKSAEEFEKINGQALPENIVGLLTKKTIEGTVLVDEFDPEILTDKSAHLSLIVTPKTEN